jgi:hypothetical protein
MRAHLSACGFVQGEAAAREGGKVGPLERVEEPDRDGESLGVALQYLVRHAVVAPEQHHPVCHRRDRRFGCLPCAGGEARDMFP